ncbi:MAG: F0F1 ATP synthase subunit A [Crocinitomicaceae bacterium]
MFGIAQNNKLKTYLLALLSFVLVSTSFANGNSAAVEEEKDFNVGEMIMHHIKDAHEWHLWGGEHDGTAIYLPVILMDGGMKVFSSANFYHGSHGYYTDPKTNKQITYLKGDGPAKGYALFHEKIYKLQEEELHFVSGHPHNAMPMDLSMTKNVVFMIISSLLILLLMIGTAKYYRRNGAVAPRGIAKFTEPLILFVRDDIAKANIGEKKYAKYVPYLLTIFFFIFVSNLLGLIPVLGANLTGNIAITFFLAVCTLLVTVFSGNKHYWGHIFWMPGVPVVMKFVMMPIELVGVLTKPFALMIRLFANITAGHIIILALVSIIFLNKSAAWGALSVPMALFISVLELLVAFLQAYLFAMLSALFIGAAVEEHHHEEHVHDEHEEIVII